MSGGALARRWTAFRSQAVPRALRISLALLGPRAAPPIPPVGARRVFVACDMGIGNMVEFLPFLRALREGLPDARIAAVFTGKGEAAAAVLDGSGLVDEIARLGSSAESPARRRAAGRRFASRGWDMGIVRFNGAAPEFAAALAFGRIRWRVGHVRGADWADGNDFLYNVPVSMPAGDHERDRYLGLARALGLPVPDPVPRLPLRPEHDAEAVEFLSALGLPEGRPFVAIHPMTSPLGLDRRWPFEKWTALLRLFDDAGISTVALGAASEREILAGIVAGTLAKNGAGLGLFASACLLRRASALVCVDGSMMHLAGAVGTPIAAIYSVTAPARTLPPGARNVALLAPDCSGGCQSLNGVLRSGCRWRECLDAISPERAFAGIRSILDRSESAAAAAAGGNR